VNLTAYRGGLIYGPFVPLTYALFQSATPAADLPAVLAARGTVVVVSSTLGIALGGPLVSLLGGGGALVASGLAAILLAAVSLLVWRREPASGRRESLDREQPET
jgi:MFS family permease